MGTGGAATAIDLLGIGAVPGEEETADLFGDMEGLAPLPIPPARRSGAKGGRPAGSPNKSTEQWRQYLMARYQSPLVGLAETWSRTPAELAKDLGLYKWHEGKPVYDAKGEHVLDTGAAATLQQNAKIASLPYWHQRQPLALEVKSETRGLVVIGTLDMPAASDDSDAFRLPLAPQQNQQLSGPNTPQSHASQSHGSANAMQIKDKTDDRA